MKTFNAETPLSKRPLSKAHKASEIPAKKTNVPKSVELSLLEVMRNEYNANKRIKDGKTGLTYEYNIKGYVKRVYNENGEFERVIYRDSSGAVKSCTDYFYDTNGNAIRYIYRNADGSVSDYIDYARDASGNLVSITSRNADGSIIA